MFKVICVKGCGKTNNPLTPNPEVGSEYTVVRIIDNGKPWSDVPGSFYELAEINPKRYMYHESLFSTLDSNLDELELVNEKELCV